MALNGKICLVLSGNKVLQVLAQQFDYETFGNILRTQNKCTCFNLIDKAPVDCARSNKLWQGLSAHSLLPGIRVVRPEDDLGSKQVQCRSPVNFIKHGSKCSMFGLPKI